jgi:hypothetical protein
MEIQITYYATEDQMLPCGASARFNGQYICRLGTSWEKSKDQVIDQIKKLMLVPDPETVQIDELASNVVSVEKGTQI